MAWESDKGADYQILEGAGYGWEEYIGWGNAINLMNAY